MKFKVCYIVSVDWAFINFRLPIAIACKKKDYEVHIITEITSQKNLTLLQEKGLLVHPVTFNRENNNPLLIKNLFFNIYNLLKTIKPDVVHLVTIKAILIGGIASRFCKIKKIVAAITGLGSSFIAKGVLSLIRKKILIILYKFLLSSKGLFLIFQNKDDQREILSYTNQEVPNCLIPGSGIDLENFTFTKEKNRKVPNVLMISRLIKDKGVIEFCEAALKVKERGLKAKFILVGDVDEGNPSSLRKDDILKYSKDNLVSFKGRTNDVITELQESNLFVLPSYREGFSKAIIEASAIGRAIITTDVPGCRDAIESEINGLLVKKRDVDDLAEAIIYLLKNPKERLEMGRKSRSIAERRFSIKNVINKHIEIYCP